MAVRARRFADHLDVEDEGREKLLKFAEELEARAVQLEPKEAKPLSG
jgi:hypothetical protein